MVTIYLFQKKKGIQIFQRMMVTYDGRVGMCCMTGEPNII